MRAHESIGEAVAYAMQHNIDLANRRPDGFASGVLEIGREHGRRELLEMLARRRVVTTNPADRDECCGLPRDEDGFCVHRPHHPIFVEATAP